MAIHKTRHNPGRHNIAPMLKGMIVLLGLVSVGYVVVVLAELSAPLLNAASQFALKSQTLSSGLQSRPWIHKQAWQPPACRRNPRRPLPRSRMSTIFPMAT